MLHVAAVFFGFLVYTGALPFVVRSSLAFRDLTQTWSPFICCPAWSLLGFMSLLFY